MIAAAIAALVFGLIQAWPFLAARSGRPPGSRARSASFLYKSLILVGGLVLFLYATEPAKAGDAATALHEPFTRADWQRIAVIVIISLFSIVFWMGFEQSGGTLNLFADEKTDRTIFGYDIPGVGLPGDQPALHHLLAPVFADPLDVPGAAAVPAPLGRPSTGMGSDPARRGVRGDVLRRARALEVGHRSRRSG